MAIVTNTSRALLNAPPSVVFAYVSDLTRHGEWSGGPLKVESLTAGPARVGSRYHSTGGMQERANDLRVTEYQPPTRFAFVATDPDFGEVLHVFTFSAREGRTLVERTVSGQLPFGTAILFRTVLYPFRGRPLMKRAMARLQAKWGQGAG